MTRHQNLQYMIASQHMLKSDTEYIPKSAQIKLELSDEKGTKEVEALQALFLSFFLSFFRSIHRGPKAYSLLGGVIPSQSIG